MSVSPAVAAARELGLAFLHEETEHNPLTAAVVESYQRRFEEFLREYPDTRAADRKALERYLHGLWKQVQK